MLGSLNFGLVFLHFHFIFDVGKRVIHSDMAAKKLMEVRKALNNDAMVRSIKNSLFSSPHILYLFKAYIKQIKAHFCKIIIINIRAGFFLSFENGPLFVLFYVLQNIKYVKPTYIKANFLTIGKKMNGLETILF